jgi:hypothetical protein
MLKAGKTCTVVAPICQIEKAFAHRNDFVEFEIGNDQFLGKLIDDDEDRDE